MRHFSIKKVRALIFILVCAFLQTNAQNAITATNWQEDLRFLQETVHSDYSFLFKKVTSEKFDSEVEKLYQEIPSMANHEVMIGFARIVSLFQYGHTRFGFHGGGVKHHKLPINLYYFNDGVYIEGTHSAHKKALGAKLLKIEGVPIKEALKMVKPVVPTENDQFFKAYGLAYLTIPEVLHAQGITKSLKETISVTLEKDGKTFDYSLPSGAPDAFRPIYSMMRQEGDWISAREQGDTPLYLKNLDKIYYYEYLPTEKAVYVRHSQIQDDPSEDIPTFYAGLFDFIENNDVEKLILDVRLNGGGNNYKVKPKITGVIKSDKINKLGSFFVIIGRRTFSASQNLINRLDNYTDVVFVGEPSSENINFYGDNRTVTLPNSKFPVFLSFAWWQDKPQWENGDWTSPHLAVDMSFEQYRTNQDPVLDSALNFSDNNFLLDPMAHLTDLFMKGEYEEVKNEATRLVNDPMYQFVDFEAQFNRAAYKMMGGEQHQGAVFVLELTAKLFPDSANAWDSLAEAHWKSNDKAKAKEYYNKAISLDPNGFTGDNARKMLKEIDKE
jgi:tetratricopeptide (TPR) repeat protein